jgi:outer membrane lipoprotein carrier protein
MAGRRIARAAVAALSLLAALPAAGESVDPWQALERLRSRLAADGHLEAEFRQSYVPAGFELGDTESGAIALAKPACLRWDYREPYRKSFLVCGSRAWSWVESEPRGQRFTIDAEREMGLDLLLLPAVELARSWRAAATRTAGRIELVLEPLDPGSELAVANLGLDRDGSRPLSLDWRDREGNVTSFRFDRWRPLESEAAFEPPMHVEWADPAAEAVR